MGAGDAGVVGGVPVGSTPPDAQFAVVGDVGAAGLSQRAAVLQPLDGTLADAAHWTAGDDRRAGQDGRRRPHHQPYLPHSTSLKLSLLSTRPGIPVYALPHFPENSLIIAFETSSRWFLLVL